ncbi:MAG: hypothetical protein ABSG05_01015 [Candidatus Pacearchaeota archaeon]|jgi:hypothetical protein
MPKVIFKFDIEKDAENYYKAANSSSKWGYDFSKIMRPEVVKKVRGKTWKKSRTYLLNMLKRGYPKDKKRFQKHSKLIKSAWKKIEKRYFKKLEKITKRKIYTKKFTCYFTTIGRCPYSIKNISFMANIFTNDASLVIAHEVMHLQFHYYFEDEIRKTLSEGKFQDLKEALTVLLNVEFKDILKEKDKGYPSHVKIRQFIVKQWKKEKDFDVLIDKCVEYLKNN